MPVVKDDHRADAYVETVRAFVQDGQGEFLACTDDKLFLDVLRKTLRLHVQVNTSCLKVLGQGRDLAREIQSCSVCGHPILFAESHLFGLDLGNGLARAKTAVPGLRVIALTGDSDMTEIALMHEHGADNFIVKPIAVQTLMVKIAFTIKPNTELRRLLDEGQARLANGRYHEAQRLAQAALTLKPDGAAAFMLLGDALAALGENKEALDAYEAAADSSSMYLAPLKRLANHHRKNGDTDRCLDYLQRLDKLSPLNVSRKLDMGEICLTLGREGDAKECFGQGMELVRKRASEQALQVTERIGAIYLENNKPEQAENYFRQVIELSDGNGGISTADVYNKMGTCLRKQGRAAEAVETICKALAAKPGDLNIAYNLALAMADTGAYEEAHAQLSGILEKNPEFVSESPVVAANFGQIAASAHKYPEARAYLETALRLRPDYARARDMLSKIG
jgi:tetratricopeptide (TPR) repeat protein